MVFIGIIIGVIVGFFLCRRFMMSYFKKNPPINEKMIETLMRNKVDLEDNKKLIITSVILTVGVSGVFLFSQSFAGVSLAMVLGVLLNLILRNKNKPLDLN